MDDSVNQFIITCDDCGLSEGINDAAIQLHEASILTTATVMTNFDAAAHAMRAFRYYPDLCVGVHLNLTDGHPLTNAPGLTMADGRFQPRTMLFTRAVFNSAAYLAAIEDEMAAQIEAFLSWGVQPTHLTTHMHFHIMPALRDIVFRLAERYNVPWVRAFKPASTVIPYNFLMQKPADVFSPDSLSITPDYVTSLQAWLNQPPQQLADTLLSLHGLTEIVVHADSYDDATYPADMNHSPAERYREMTYIQDLHRALSQGGEPFRIGDPAEGVLVA